jgi:hypothetical protein
MSSDRFVNRVNVHICQSKKRKKKILALTSPMRNGQFVCPLFVQAKTWIFLENTPDHDPKFHPAYDTKNRERIDRFIWSVANIDWLAKEHLHTRGLSIVICKTAVCTEASQTLLLQKKKKHKRGAGTKLMFATVIVFHVLLLVAILQLVKNYRDTNSLAFKIAYTKFSSEPLADETIMEVSSTMKEKQLLDYSSFVHIAGRSNTKNTGSPEHWQHHASRMRTFPIQPTKKNNLIIIIITLQQSTNLFNCSSFLNSLNQLLK